MRLFAVAARFRRGAPGLPVMSLLGLIALVAAPGPAGAVSLCVEPLTPLCIDTAKGTNAREQCRREARAYATKLEDYARCMREAAEQAEKKAKHVRDEFGFSGE